jgi:hypothetical protein
MASNVTDWGENAFLGALIGATSAVPGTFYMGLLTQAPVASDDGTTVMEPLSASGYSRVSFSNSSSFWSAASGGVVINTGTITFPIASADWTVVTHYGLFTAATAGNMYMYAPLQLPRVVQAGHLCKFDPGQLSISLQGARQTIMSS